MSEYIPTLEESVSDMNLSVQKTRVSTTSDFVPNFCQKSGLETDSQEPIRSFRFNPEISDKLSRRSQSIQFDGKPPLPKPTVITEISEKGARSTSEKKRPQSMSMSFSSNKKKVASPDYGSLNTSLVSPMRPNTAKNAKVPKSRDGSPIVMTRMALYVQRRTQNRSVEIKSIIAQENMKQHGKSKTAGKVVHGSTNQRKEVEKQLLTLENRLNRLKLEESNTLKKVDETAEQAEKTLAMKMRHKEDLATKELRDKKREESIQRRREEINKEREETKMRASTAVLEMLKDRYNHAYNMKKTAEKGKSRERERRRLEDEKRKDVKDGIKTWIKTSKMTRGHNENLVQKDTSNNYSEKARMEKERAQELMAKCKQMQEEEQELLRRIGQTRSLHSAKMNELQNIKAINVNN